MKGDLYAIEFAGAIVVRFAAASAECSFASNIYAATLRVESIGSAGVMAVTGEAEPRMLRLAEKDLVSARSGTLEAEPSIGTIFYAWTSTYHTVCTFDAVAGLAVAVVGAGPAKSTGVSDVEAVTTGEVGEDQVKQLEGGVGKGQVESNISGGSILVSHIGKIVVRSHPV